MQKLGSILLVSLFLMTGTLAKSQTIQFEKYTLPNGLKIILHEDHSAPVVAVTALYHVGSKNEDTARTGFAHFFEHLLFEGTDNIKRGEFDKYVTNAGGALNANSSIITGLSTQNFYSGSPKNMPTNSLGLYYDVGGNQRLGMQVMNRKEAYGSFNSTSAVVTYTAGL